MKLQTYGLALLSALSATTTQAGNFILQPERSELKAEMHASPSHDFSSAATTFQTDIQIDPDTLTIEKASCHFNFSALDSGTESRDKKMCKWMEIEAFPGADFTLTKIEPTEAAGQLKATGTLAMHGKSIPVIVQLEVSRNGKEVTLDGTTEIDYRNWGLPKIRLFIFTVDPVLKPSFHLVGTLASEKSS